MLLNVFSDWLNELFIIKQGMNAVYVQSLIFQYEIFMREIYWKSTVIFLQKIYIIIYAPWAAGWG